MADDTWERYRGAVCNEGDREVAIPAPDPGRLCADCGLPIDRLAGAWEAETGLCASHGEKRGACRKCIAVGGR